MRMGFTGTRSVSIERMSEVCDVVRQACFGFTEFTTGACVGFDTIAAHYVLDLVPDATHRLIVPADRKHVDNDVIARFKRLEDERHIIEYMPEGTSYRDRNERILHYTDKLVAVAEHPEIHARSIRSGTWMTVRIARRLGLPIQEFIIWPAA